MRRYDINIERPDWDSHKLDVSEQEDGEWCKWEDVKVLLAFLTEREADVEVYKIAYRKEHDVCTKWLTVLHRFREALTKIAKFEYGEGYHFTNDELIARKALEKK